MKSLTKIVIDTCSISNFFYFYRFDRNEDDSTNYNFLFKFFIDKIKAGEIIIIDKVMVELLAYNDPEDNFDLFHRLVKDYIVNTKTATFTADVIALYNDYKSEITENFSKTTKTEDEKGRLINKYKDRDADLYLVTYCKELSQSEKVLLITDENKRQLGQFPKIPNICKNKCVDCDNLPNLLFKHYNSEMVFKITKPEKKIS